MAATAALILLHLGSRASGSQPPSLPSPVTWTTLFPEPGNNKEGTPTYLNTMPIGACGSMLFAMAYCVAALTALPMHGSFLPCLCSGNGHAAGNVVIERNVVKVLISSSSSYGEDGEMLKVALLEVTLTASTAFPYQNFNQTFNPITGTVTIATGTGITVTAYAEARSSTASTAAPYSDTIVVAVDGDASASAKLLPIRVNATSSRPIFDCHTYTRVADTVAAAADDLTLVYHRNVDAQGAGYKHNTLSVENIPETIAGFGNPLYHRATGAAVAARGAQAAEKLLFVVSVRTDVDTPSASAFESALVAQAQADAERVTSDFAKDGSLPSAAHSAWWMERWTSSYISISGPDATSDAAVVSNMYALQRFIELAQAGGNVPYPIKFNGMLYTANRAPNGDVKQWGALNWWQNARLPYYNMLTSGDSDALLTLLSQYNLTVPVAKARTKAYFGFEDGLWWPEYTHALFGTTHPASYRSQCVGHVASEPDWHSDDRWNGYNRQGSLDLSLFILDHFAFTQRDAGLMHIPIGVVKFYANLWGNTTSTSATGRMVFFPTQAVETWQCPGWPVDPDNCPTNDMPTVAGLRSVLLKLIALPTDGELFMYRYILRESCSQFDWLPLTSLTIPGSVAGVTTAAVATWKALLAIVPALPVINGTYAPCSNCYENGTAHRGANHTSNVENPELYAVHPYRLATAARGDADALAKARAAFKAMRFKGDSGWNQVAMDAALMGNAADARKYVVARAKTKPAAGYRFPVFAPHEQDYEPSGDHFAVFSNALQYMLIQRVDGEGTEDGDDVLLLPAWPCEWDVEFKVHAPRNAVVTGSLKNGTLAYSVVPGDRQAHVRAAKCQDSP